MATKRTDVLGGLGYVGEKLGVGFMRSVEGIWDYTAGGIAKFIGNDEWAEDQVMNSWFGDWYEHPDQWYEASDGWRVAGDVVGAIGTSLPSIGLAFIPAAGPYLAIGSAGLGAAGTSVTDAAKEKGELTDAMFGYGALTGAFEGLMEYATGGTGGIIKDIAAKTAKESTEAVIRSGAKTLLKKAGADAIQGAVEEGMATFMEPYFARATYDPNAQNATMQEVAYSAFTGALSEALMGTGYTLGSDAISGSKLVSNGRGVNTLEMGRAIAEFEAENGTLNEQFELVRSTYEQLRASLDATGGKVTTVRQRMQLGALQRYNTAAVFSPMISRSAVNIINNAEAVAQRATQYGYKTADGNSLAFTKEELLKGIKFDNNGKIDRKSLGKALANNEALRTLAINQTVGNLIMNNRQFVQATLSGDASATMADVSRFLETGTDAEIQAVGDALGISNWAEVDSDTLHGLLEARNAFGIANEYKAATKAYNAISAEKAHNTIPRRISMSDGIRRFKDGNADIAVEKNGHDYYIYDYESGARSRKLSYSEMNNALLKYKTSAKSTVVKENSVDGKNNSENVSNNAEVEESPRAKERREIDEYCRSNVRKYSQLSAEGQATVRRVIRNARAYNMAEADVLSYARVSAHSGLDIFFSRRLTADGSLGYIDPRRNRIVVNPDSVTQEGILLHELDHTVRMYIGKDGKIHTKAYKKAIDSSPEALKTKVGEMYQSQNRQLSRKEVISDETNAYFAQMVFTNKGVLEKLLAPRQSLAGRILEFFREANTAYSDDPKLSKAARDYYRKYKKWFDEMSERNFGMNEYEGTVAMKDKRAKQQNKPKSVVGKSGADDDDTRKSFSSIANSFFGNADMTAAEFGKSDYRETEGYKQYFEQCLNNFKNSRGEAFDEKSASKEISDSIDGIVRVAVAMKRAGYDIYDDAAKRGAKDSKNRALFSSLEPNSDYFTSSDISTICDKRINFADIYDAIVNEESKRNVPKGKRFFDNVDNYFYLHKVLADKGLTQPCRQCYVESMRKNLAPMANAFIKLVNEPDAENRRNEQLYDKKGVLKKNNAQTREWVRSTLEGEYGTSADVLTVETLTTEDGLAQLRIQMPLIYEAFNSFYGQSKPKMPKSATPFRFGELTALLTDNRGNIKKDRVEKINSTGGFRLQSYSDFQIQNYADVLAVIFEAGTLGLKGHAYTKVPAFLDATAGTNLKRNISVFMYNDGGQWKLDRNDSFPYTLDEIYGIVNNDESGNTSIIAVSQNDANSAWIMANPKVGYGIPFHKSGQKMGTVRDTDVKTEDGRVVKGYSDIKDHTKQQTEVWAKATADHKANTKVSKGINIYSFWDFSNQRLSQKNLIIKNLKNYIDACDEAGYLPKFRAYLMNNDAILRKTLEYAKEFGTVGADATVEDISFEYKGYRIPYGYYKFLGDFGMFKPDGKASPQEVLSLKSYDFDYAVDYFSDAETLRRNEILQQFSNGPEREAMRASGMTAEQLEAEVRKRRRAVVDEIADKDIRKSVDLEYLKAVESGDTETAQKMVDEAAKKAGYSTEHLYHGTSMFGFTNIDVSSASDDSISFFATNRQEVASGYMPWYEDDASDLHHDDVRRIGVPDKSRPRGLSSSYSAERILTEAQKVFPEYKDARVATDDEVLTDLKTYWLTETIEAAEKLREIELSIGSNKLRQQVRDMCDAVIAASKEDTLDAWKAVGNRYKEFDSIDIPYDATDMRPQIFRSRILGGLQQIGKFAKTTAIMLDGKLTSTAAIVDSYNSFLGGETLGMYDLYTKQGNQLVIQGRGSSWNQLPLGKFEVEYMEWLGDKASEELSGKRVTTRDVAAFAKAKGYRSVAFYDIYDNGAYGSAADISDVYAFFYPNEDVKSADPVTYDDDGKVIPLSQRFNSADDDIRKAFDLDSISSTLDRTQTQKRPEYKGGKREIVSDAMTKASIDFVNEFAGAEKYLRKSGLSREDAETVSQFMRSASARADAAVSMYQYDLAGLDSAVNVSGSKKLDRNRIRSLRQGEGILPIIDAATAEIVKNHGKDGINKESALHAFSDYMFHQHNIDRMSLEARSRAALAPADLTRLETLEADPNAKKRDIDALKKELGVEENKPVFGEIEGVRGAITAAESRAIVADYEAAFPEFRSHAEKVWKFFRNNMQYQVDTQQMTEADKAYFENKYPHYIPTNRLVKPISISAVRGSGAVAVKNTVKKAVGSGRMLAPLLETAMERTLEVYRAGGANRLANAIYDAHMRIGDSDTDVQIVSRYKTSDPDSLVPEKPRRGQITFFRDGEVITMKVTDVIEAAFEAQRADTSSFIVNMLAAANSGFKRLVTSMNPTFAISNSVKDAFDGVFNSQHPLEFMFGLVSLSGYREIFRKDRGVLELFYATGGLSSSVYDIQKGFTASRGKRGFQKVRKNKTDGKLSKLAKNVGAAQLANAVENVNQAIEMIPRLVEFKNLLKRGVSPVQAALGAAEVTTNFSRSGRITKKFNRTVIPFLNATVQGSAKLVRNVLGARGFRGISKLLLTATLAGITPQILNQLLIGALGGDLEEEYEELRDSDKMNYFIIPNIISGEGFIRIPKGRIMSAWAGAVVQATRMKNGLEPEFGEYVEAILSTLTPADSVTRNIFSPFIDLSTNTTWYGGEIEGQQYDNTEPKYRYDEGTSSLAVALGQSINYSPIKIQYLFDQYSGVIGDVIIPITDSEVDKGMFASKFTVDANSSNRLSSEFYKLYDEAQYSKTNYSAGRITDDTAVYQLKYLNAVKKEISLLYDQQSAIQTSSLSKVEKMKQLKVVQAMINSLYRTALDDYEKVTSAAMLTANLGYGADDDKERYAETVRIVYGAERALSQYNSSVYERMKEIHDKTGIDYEALYTYYFATKGLTADKDVNGNTVAGSKKQKVLRVINSLGITQKQKRQLYEMIYN